MELYGTAPLATVQLCEYEDQTLEALWPAVCMPSLIVQWPARIVHFQLLCIIVKLACSNLILGLTSDRMSIFALKTLKLEQVRIFIY